LIIIIIIDNHHHHSVVAPLSYLATIFATQFDLEQRNVSIGVTGRQILTLPIIFHHRYRPSTYDDDDNDDGG